MVVTNTSLTTTINTIALGTCQMSILVVGGGGAGDNGGGGSGMLLLLFVWLQICRNQKILQLNDGNVSL